MSYTSVEDLRTSTPDQFWHWWLNSSPYTRPGPKVEVDKWLLINKRKAVQPYVHVLEIGYHGVRKSLWHTCRHCEHCNGVMFEDSNDWHVSADCKFSSRDIIKDKEFTECPLGKWIIKRPRARGKGY